jgi:PKD repeat protein
VKKLISSVMLIMSLAVFAAQVSKSTAEQVAENFYSKFSGSSVKIESTSVIQRETSYNNIVWYGFGFEKGFVVVSGNDLEKPVLAYSFKHEMARDLSRGTSDYDEWMYSFDKKAVSYMDKTDKALPEWEDIISGRFEIVTSASDLEFSKWVNWDKWYKPAYDKSKETKANSIMHIHWGTTNTPLDGLTVTWRNNGTSDQIKWGYTTSFEMGTFSGVRRSNYSENLYDYTFGTVTANSTIYYQIYDSDDASWTATKTYQTAKNPNEPYRILTMGDSRTNLTDWQKVANLAVQKNADFTIFNGDIIDVGTTGSQWDSWFNYGADFIASQIILHSIGNHEGDDVIYLNQFVLPNNPSGNERYHAVEWGNLIYICLDSENPSNSTQYNWLVNTLQTHQNKTWKIVNFHKPFYAIGSHAGEMDSYFNTWWKAFDDYGVDLITNGHDHYYMRSKPVNRNVSTTSAVAEYGSDPGQGRCEIIAGGAGAPLYSGSPAWFTQVYNMTLGFTMFDVDGGTIQVTSLNSSNTVVDQFTLQKALATDFTGTPTEIFEGQTVSFTDLSTQDPTSWNWTFNGGTPSSSTSQNPSVTYNTAGTYDVTLQSSNGIDTDTVTKTGYITVYAANPPVTNFSANKTSVSPGELITFTDLSTNVPTSWSWTFTGGTPSSSTSQNPGVTYSTPGTYDVSLTSTNAYGSDNETKTGYITVNNTGSIELSIINGNDDVEQFMDIGDMYFDSSDLEFNDDAGNQQVGLRFQGVNIPQGATITSAYVSIQCDEQDTRTLNHIKYAAEDIDNSPAFTTAAWNLSSRTKTSNIVTWTNPPSWYVGTIYNFPDMSAVVQEVVDRPGWASGNSMTFIFYKTDSDADERCAESYEGGAPPKLYVEYTIPMPAPPATPALSSPADASLTTDLTPTFDWSDVSGATSYTIQVDNNSDFSSPEITNSPTVSTYTPAVDLAAGTYYWRVLATNAGGSSSYSASWSLTVQTTIIPGVPANIVTSISGTDLVIDWDPAADATSYDVYSSNDPYGTFTFAANVATNQYVVPYTDSKKFYYVISKNATK